MSTETLHADVAKQPSTWWVRDDRGGRYGPVSFEVLKSWARDGRIGPANEISKDGVEWSLATAEPALEMEWVAEVEAGRFYGPIHHDAVQGLINDGALTRRAPLFRRTALGAWDTETECQRLTVALQQALDARTELEASLQQALAARAESETSLQHALAAHAQSEADWRQALAACEEALGQARADLAAWGDRARQMEADLAQSRADAQAWQTRFQEADARRRELERQQEEQTAVWRQQRQSLQQQIQTLEEQSAAWQQQRQSLQQQIQSLEEQSSVWQQMRLDMQQQLQTAEEAYRAVQRERTEWQVEAQRALAEAATRQQRIASLESEVDALRKSVKKRHAADTVIDVEVLPPEKPAAAPFPRPHSKPPVSAGVPAEGFNGLSLAELERQAQRELERLGAHGQTFFAKKR